MTFWMVRLSNYFRCQHLCGRLIPWFAVLGVATLSLGWVWSFGFAPADYQQGNSFRIMYIHVPTAIWSMGVYASMAIAAFIGLVWQMKMADLVSSAMASIGAVFTFIALITGSAWGKPMWGTWWIWDACLTSELVLLFIYMGVIALYHSFEERRTAGRVAGILILVGVVNLPIIHFSVQWWNTLHQGSSGILQQAIAPSMRTPLRWAILGYLLSTWIPLLWQGESLRASGTITVVSGVVFASSRCRTVGRRRRRRCCRVRG